MLPMQAKLASCNYTNQHFYLILHIAIQYGTSVVHPMLETSKEYRNEHCGQYSTDQYTCEELLNKASLPSLVTKRLQDILILMYKVKHSLAPEHICNIFYKQDKHYNLRRDFPIPRYSTVIVDIVQIIVVASAT